MDKIKKLYRSIPICPALFLFLISALLIASFITSKITVIANEKSFELQVKYITVSRDLTQGDSDVIYSGDGVGEVLHYDFNYDEYTEADWRLYQTYHFILRFASAFVYSICILAAVLLFYYTKLKKPLAVLTNASNRIAENELDFALDYSGSDEMARLCTAFEKMRSALDENSRCMLHMIDQRKQLNDAYTHDLRTPIAVLKGYTDMLTKYIPTGKMSQEEVLETVSTMSTHVARLEQFTESMNTVQKLEDLTLQKAEVNAGEFIGHLQESTDILCQSAGLACEFVSEVKADTLCLDTGVVIQVYENLMSNATRFAQTKVTIRCGCEGNAFFVSVADDGKGFTEKELLKADQPYYSGETQKQEYHFGLGLHICRTLCEKHGGSLKLENTPQGGAKITASFATTK